MIKTYPRICASIAGNPSQLGVKMHNAGYLANNLNYTYIAMGADAIEEGIQVLKLLDYRGLGVSMPFKKDIIKHLDLIDESVQKIGACNTVVNNSGNLIGYNTDWIGAQDAINEVVNISTIKRAVIVGAGGVARAIAYALKVNGVDVFISARDDKQRKILVQELDLSGETDLAGQGKFNAELVVNATPDSSKSGPVNLQLHPNCSVVFDVAFNKLMTDLTKEAVATGKKYVPGWRMLLLQGAKQFELYTNQKAPVEDMGQVILDWLQGET